jgi:hypothetical protein
MPNEVTRVVVPFEELVDGIYKYQITLKDSIFGVEYRKLKKHKK